MPSWIQRAFKRVLHRRTKALLEAFTAFKISPGSDRTNNLKLFQTPMQENHWFTRGNGTNTWFLTMKKGFLLRRGLFSPGLYTLMSVRSGPCNSLLWDPILSLRVLFFFYLEGQSTDFTHQDQCTYHKGHNSYTMSSVALAQMCQTEGPIMCTCKNIICAVFYIQFFCMRKSMLH